MDRSPKPATSRPWLPIATVLKGSLVVRQRSSGPPRAIHYSHPRRSRPFQLRAGPRLDQSRGWFFRVRHAATPRAYKSCICWKSATL